jgi:hypothetical protein
MNANYEVLYDGVPHWMQQSLTAWLGAMLSDVLMAEQSGMDVLHRTERALRIKVALTYGTTDLGVTRALLERFRGNELQLTDYLLSTVPLDRLGGWEEVKDHLHDPEIVFGQLEILLKEAGSKWQIGIRSGGSMGLVQRVPEGVEAALTQTIESSGRAGARLASAWASAFGISPHPSQAYSLAVKAVEDAAVQVVCPNDSLATLGKIISQMRNAGGWNLPLPREDEHATTSSTLISMMKMLWAGQADRHGGNHDPALEITQEAAEVAVMTAATLVQWFSSGAVARRG